MNFDLGTSALRRALAPRTYTMRGVVTSAGSPARVRCTMDAGDERHLEFYARPLLAQSFSYEVGDAVIVEVRSLCEAYILGLAAELEGTDIDTEFHVRLGRNVIKGRKDGTLLEFSSGDDGFRIEHTPAGTTVETRGLLSLTGDMVMLGDGMGMGINCMSVCPIKGVHIPSSQKVLM